MIYASSGSLPSLASSAASSTNSSSKSHAVSLLLASSSPPKYSGSDSKLSMLTCLSSSINSTPTDLLSLSPALAHLIPPSMSHLHRPLWMHYSLFRLNICYSHVPLQICYYLQLIPFQSKASQFYVVHKAHVFVLYRWPISSMTKLSL